MQDSTRGPFLRALALFGGFLVPIVGGTIARALIGPPWGDVIGQVIFVTSGFPAFMFALEGRLPKKLGVGLALAVANLSAFEYFRWNRGEPLATGVLIAVVVANVALLMWQRPWRGDAKSVKVTLRRS